jgi:hypothetical protein
MGIDNTGYGEDTTYGNDGGRSNATTRGPRWGQRRPRTKGNNASATPATTSAAQCWQWRQRNAGETPAQCRQTPALYQPDLWGLTWQQHRCNAGNKDSLMLAMTPMWCRQGHQRNTKKREIRKKKKKRHRCLGQTVEGQIAVGWRRVQQQGHGQQQWAWQQCLTGNVLRLHHDWPEASLWCWRQCGYAKGNNASGTGAKMPMQWGQQCRRYAGNNDGAMLAMTPAHVATASWQGRCQFAMLAATWRWQGQQCQHNKGKSAHVMRAMTLAQRRQQGQQHDAGKDASAMRAKHECNASKLRRLGHGPGGYA